MRLALCPHCQALHSPEGIIVDAARGSVVWPDGEMPLSGNQLVIVFELLLRRTGTVVRRETLIDQVYGLRPEGAPDSTTKTVELWAWRLRAAMRRSAFPGELRTHWGRGYELILHPIAKPAIDEQAEAMA